MLKKLVITLIVTLSVGACSNVSKLQHNSLKQRVDGMEKQFRVLKLVTDNPNLLAELGDSVDRYSEIISAMLGRIETLERENAGLKLKLNDVDIRLHELENPTSGDELFILDNDGGQGGLGEFSSKAEADSKLQAVIKQNDELYLLNSATDDVVNKDYDSASEKLQSLIENTKDSEIKQTAQLRQLEILDAKKNYTKFLEQYSEIYDELGKNTMTEIKMLRAEVLRKNDDPSFCTAFDSLASTEPDLNVRQIAEMKMIKYGCN